MIIAAALAQHAHAVRRKFAGRHRTIGASEVGQCMRRLLYLKTEGDPVRGAQRNPDYVEGWGNPTRGSIFEAHFWEPALRRRYGNRLRFAGKAQKTFVKGFLSATPDGLITGLHEPRASHLDLLEASAGKELLERSYLAALEHCYLWHEFGDSQLILP